MHLMVRLVLALASGAAVGLAFPPYGLWPLLLVGLVGVVALVHGLAPRRAALVGLVFGLAYLGVLLPWLRVIGPDAWVAVTLLESLFYAAFGWAAAWVRPYRWWPPATAGLWAGVELARSQLPFSGFPWGKIAFALADTPLQAYVRYVGVPALGALVVGCAALAWWGWLRVRDPVRPGRLAASIAWVVAVTVVASGPLLPVGLSGPSEPLRVAAVQGGIPGTGASGLGEQREVVTDHSRATQQYAADVRAGVAEPADVVFWPENSTDIDPATDAQTFAAIDAAVAAVDVPVLVGAVTAGSTPDLRRNSGVVWSPTTGPGDTYVKRHLVPFGEYIPLRGLLAPLFSRLDQIPRDFEAGDEVGVLDLGPVVVADSMCYDVAFEGVVAPAVAAGAELLVVQTNNATYQQTGQPDQQWAISRLRAIETGRDLVVASTNGISGIVGADGAVLAKSTSSDPVVLTATVRRADGITPAVRVGSWLELGLSGAGLLGLVVAVGATAGGRRRTADPRRDGAAGHTSDPPREPAHIA